MHDFDTFLETAWRDHGEEPELVAQRLATAASALDAPAEIPPFVRLVAHVYGEHLGRWHAALELIDALRQGPAFDGSAEIDGALIRAAAMLRYASGDERALDSLPPSDALAALSGAAAILAGRDAFARAIAAFDAALEMARARDPEPGSPAVRALAVLGNNLAAALEQKPQRTPAETRAMIAAADIGLEFWRRAGTWLEEERAHYRRGRSLLAAGLPDAAQHAARLCLGVCAANDAPAFERFFAEALMAATARALDDSAGCERARASALAAWRQLTEAERASCTSELREIEAPPLAQGA